MTYLKLICLSLLIVVGCTTSEKPNPDVLLTVDREFSSLSFEKGMNHAFSTYVDEEGVILRNNSYPIIGKENVVNRLTQQSDTTFKLTWEPMFADIAVSGELGYTYGTYLISSNKGDSLGVGTYVSIWKKMADGQWKFVFDAGNDGL